MINLTINYIFCDLKLSINIVVEFKNACSTHSRVNNLAIDFLQFFLYNIEKTFERSAYAKREKAVDTR